MRSLADHFTRGGLMHLGAVGGGKFSFRQMRFVLGWGLNRNLTMGLKHGLKAIGEDLENSPYALGLGWD